MSSYSVILFFAVANDARRAPNYQQYKECQCAHHMMRGELTVTPTITFFITRFLASITNTSIVFIIISNGCVLINDRNVVQKTHSAFFFHIV